MSYLRAAVRCGLNQAEHTEDMGRVLLQHIILQVLLLYGPSHSKGKRDTFYFLPRIFSTSTSSDKY